MTSREEILARIRIGQPAPRPLPAIPTFDVAKGPAALERFKTALLRMGGKLADAPADRDLDALVRRLHPDARIICSATPEAAGNRRLADVVRPADLSNVDVGIVRAAFAVAETGSVWLTEGEFRVNALGFLVQHLVVLLDPARIVPNMHHAYRERGQFDAGYGVFMTGPSATADIEGILIHGAQGIRTLTVVPLAA